MRILDKYILKELMGPFLFGVFAFSSVMIATSTLFRIAQYITQYGASIWSVTKIFFYSLPSIIVLTFPMSMLLATLLSFGRLSGGSEITAMRSCGQSFKRLAMPVFIVAFIVSVLTVIFNELVVPRANNAYQNVVRYEVEGNTTPRSQDHIIIKDVKEGNIQRLTYARSYDEKTGAMHAVTLQEFDDKNRLTRVEHADRATWAGNRWIMQSGMIYEIDPQGGLERTMKFSQQVLPISKSPETVMKEQKKPEEMNIGELRQHIRVLRGEYVKTDKFEVELHQRFTIPVACFVFALLGAPLGLQPHRSSSSIGFGISVVIIFVYYAIMTITTALGQGGAISPILAAWIPNIIGIAVGLWMVRRASV